MQDTWNYKTFNCYIMCSGNNPLQFIDLIVDRNLNSVWLKFL
jgi:hypothetical protein